MKHYFTLLFLLILATNYSFSQGIVRGVVVDAATGEPLSVVDVRIAGTGIYVLSDTAGFYQFDNVPLGFQEVEFSSFGYENFLSESVQVTVARPTIVNAELSALIRQVGVVQVKARSVRRAENPPIGVTKLSIQRIERTPGGNRDISKVVQSLPGVATTSVERNDIIVRGGGSNENKFFIDRIEIPVLNHFQTQGGSGGNVSVVNSDLLSGATLYTSAFPVSKGNALSSVLDMQFREGNSEGFETRLVVGASDVGLTIDTPLGDKSSLIASYRLSYLQLLFQVLKLPFLPTYQDFQFKWVYKFNRRNKLRVIGIGAYDINRLNLNMSDLEPDKQQILNYLPENDQWSYVVGAVYTHYLDSGTLDIVVSHNQLDNSFNKWVDNDRTSTQTLDYNSREGEVKGRVEYNSQLNGGYVLNLGLTAEVGWYSADNTQLIYLGDKTFWEEYNAGIGFVSYSAYGSLNRRFIDDKFRVMFSLRLDGNNYNLHMSNPLNQISPRVALSWQFSNAWSVSANFGRYYQDPSYTTLGYKDSLEVLVNKERLDYIGSNQLTVGGEWRVGGRVAHRLGIEAFYKHYDHYPMSLVDSTAIGSDNGQFVTGAVPASSVGKAYAWGAEIVYQNDDLWGCNLFVSYTYVNSMYAKLNEEFKPTQKYIPSDWDYRHIFNIIIGREFLKGWEVGLRWRYCGGAPYTPYDYDLSAQIDNWNTNKEPVFDYSLNNTLRLPAFHQLDLRVDKTWYFRDWTFGVYVDIQNLYNSSAYGEALFVPVTDLDGNYVEDLSRPGYYEMVEYSNRLGGTILPTFGFVFEF